MTITPKMISDYIDRDHNHYNGKNCWFVEHSDGMSQMYTPYDSIGMNSFVCKGFTKGKVTINGYEVVPIDSTWKFKENE